MYLSGMKAIWKSDYITMQQSIESCKNSCKVLFSQQIYTLYTYVTKGKKGIWEGKLI